MNDRPQCYDLSGAILPLHFYRKARAERERQERRTLEGAAPSAEGRAERAPDSRRDFAPETRQKLIRSASVLLLCALVAGCSSPAARHLSEIKLWGLLLLWSVALGLFIGRAMTGASVWEKAFVGSVMGGVSGAMLMRTFAALLLCALVVGAAEAQTMPRHPTICERLTTHRSIERERIARRMYEAVNGTDPKAYWAPGGWEKAKEDRSQVSITAIYWRNADEAMKILSEVCQEIRP